jgi:hypothetical protein
MQRQDLIDDIKSKIGFDIPDDQLDLIVQLTMSKINVSDSSALERNNQSYGKLSNISRRSKNGDSAKGH